jgi:hypothetical protein
MAEDARLLGEAGSLLFGSGWHRALARALGPFHLDGARERADDRLIRRWACGARAVPSWALEAAASLVAAEHARAAEVFPRYAEIVPRLRGAAAKEKHGEDNR